MRLDIRRIASLKEAEAVIGSRAKVKVVKNKVAPPFREAEFDILYGEGISKEGDLLDLAVDHRIVEKSGAWYAFNGERMGQGRENARQFLKDNKDIRNEVENRLRQGLGLPTVDFGPAAAAQAAAAGGGKPEKGARSCPCRRRRKHSHAGGRLAGAPDEIRSTSSPLLRSVVVPLLFPLLFPSLFRCSVTSSSHSVPRMGGPRTALPFDPSRAEVRCPFPLS